MVSQRAAGMSYILVIMTVIVPRATVWEGNVLTIPLELRATLTHNALPDDAKALSPPDVRKNSGPTRVVMKTVIVFQISVTSGAPLRSAPYLMGRWPMTVHVISIAIAKVGDVREVGLHTDASLF